MHPFFNDIKKHPALEDVCNTVLLRLPEKYVGKSKIKAVLLGADPTNNGIKSNGLLELDFVFGINSNYEKNFFQIQKTNLEAIGLSKENCYIQNLCRNYFRDQTAKNVQWNAVAEIWGKYLKEEIQFLDPDTPILATSQEVFTFLTKVEGPFTSIYDIEIPPIFYSKYLNRTVIALFRSVRYILYKDKWPKYQEYLRTYFNQFQ